MKKLWLIFWYFLLILPNPSAAVVAGPFGSKEACQGYQRLVEGRNVRNQFDIYPCWSDEK